jgi:hypothetical protein
MCRVALAQEPDETKLPPPVYLSNLSALSHINGIRTGKATFLGTVHLYSVAHGGPLGYGEARYAVPDGYVRFQAIVGVDDTFSDTNIEFTFTVNAIDANGQPHVLDTPRTAIALHQPATIDVSVKGMKILILKVAASTGRPDPAWWGDAQFAASGSTATTLKGSATKTRLVFDEDAFKERMQRLAQQLKKDMDTEAGTDKKVAVSIAQFTLNSLPDQSLDEKVAIDVQDALNDQLNQIKSIDLTVCKESFGDSLKQDWTPGDSLEDRVRIALRKEVDTRYLLLGRVSDRKDQAAIAASLYDLSTGKSVGDETIRIPVKERRTTSAPVEATTDPQGLAPVTLIFAPSTELRVRSFQWFVDDMPQAEKPLTSTIVTTIVPVPAGRHKFKLIWSGAGYHVAGTQLDPYQSVILEAFEIDTSKSASVQLSAKVDPFPRRLNLTVRAGSLILHPHLQ